MAKFLRPFCENPFEIKLWQPLKPSTFMWMRGGFLLIILWFAVTGTTEAQSYPKNYFRHPVDGKLALAGTFGELRSYHFHMGLDIKAHQGTPVKAAAEGNLFRIKVSKTGYGKVLYVNHPNGYTTVYAHLSRFSDTLERFIRAEQYRAQSEEIDLSLPDTAFVFKKGEVIAWSGNTGSSAGPHLHFEIRDTQTEEAFNPLLFGIKIKDDVKPTVQGIKVYPMNETSLVEGKNEGRFYSLKLGKSAVYKKNLTVKAWGEIAFAFQAHDYTTESSNRCGIYEIQLYDHKKKKLFGQQIAHVGFDVTRYINTYKDFAEFHDKSRHLHKSYIRGNNRLNVYTEKDKTGIIEVKGSDTLHFYVKAFDVAGNKDSVHIIVIPQKAAVKAPAKKDCNYPLKWNETFVFKNDQFEVNILPGSVYNDACFNYYSRKRHWQKAYSDQHAMYTNLGEPVQESFDVMIKPDTAVDSTLRSKLLIVRTTDFKSMTPYKTAYIDSTGCYGAQVRSFGTFCLVADTLAPTIVPLGYKDSLALSKKTLKELAFEIRDELSGLKRYKLFVNEQWVLTDFNLKKEKMVVIPAEIGSLGLAGGYYPIRVEAIDHKENKAVFEGVIKWEVAGN